MQFVIDIDDTIIYSNESKCFGCGRNLYEMIKIDWVEVSRVNKLYDEGHTIILYTGRGWDCYEKTIEQLKLADIKYHELVMGKPLGIYVDKDSIKTLEGINDNQSE